MARERNRKSFRSALALSALKGFAEGRKERDEFNKLVAERELKKQNEEFNRAAKLFELGITTKKAGLGQATITSGGDIITSQPLVKEDSAAYNARLQQMQELYLPKLPQPQALSAPALRTAADDLVPPLPEQTVVPNVSRLTVQTGETNIPKSEFLRNPAKYQNIKGLKIIDDVAGPTTNPENVLGSLRFAQKLLGRIPTDLSTLGTAGVSKMLGGQRRIGGQDFGSDAIKAYEDHKGGTAVSVYRSITGDTRLSDADAQARALPYMPSVFPVVDTAAVRKLKMDRLVEATKIAQAQRGKNPAAELNLEDVMGQADTAVKENRYRELIALPQLTPAEAQELQMLDAELQ